jgi:hypothetical protein
MLKWVHVLLCSRDARERLLASELLDLKTRLQGDSGGGQQLDA